MNTISKGTLYSFNNDYSIYELNANNSLTYYLSMPNKDINNCQLYLGFPTLEMNTYDNELTITEINKMAEIIHKINPNGIYLFCNLPFNELYEASNDNDDKLYGILFNKLHIITKDAYDAISTNNDVFVNPKILAIKQNNIDTKFVDWLEIRLNDFIDGITYKSLLRELTTIQDDGNSDFGTRSNNGGSITNTKSDVKVKKLVKPQTGRKGFSSFAFIILILVIALFMGVGLAYLLIK